MGWKIARGFAAMGLALVLQASVAAAGSTWEGLKADVYGDRVIRDGHAIMEFSAPNRPEDQSKVPLAVKARLEDGRTIRSVSFIVDENPSPVAAVFRMGDGRTSVSLKANFRLNAATDVRAVIEASDGELYMISRHVKFAGGQAACAAPPAGDPEEILANMGRMHLEHAGSRLAVSELRPSVRLDVSHPNHTGMVLDQITLLYTPLQMVTEIEVHQGADLVFAMQGSITLSQDPAIDFDYRVNGSDRMHARVRDSDGGEWTRSFPIGQGS